MSDQKSKQPVWFVILSIVITLGSFFLVMWEVMRAHQQPVASPPSIVVPEAPPTVIIRPPIAPTPPPAPVVAPPKKEPVVTPVTPIDFTPPSPVEQVRNDVKEATKNLDQTMEQIRKEMDELDVGEDDEEHK